MGRLGSGTDPGRARIAGGIASVRPTDMSGAQHEWHRPGVGTRLPPTCAPSEAIDIQDREVTVLGGDETLVLQLLESLVHGLAR